MQVAASNPAATQLASRTAASALSRHAAVPAFAKVLAPRGLAGALVKRGGSPAGHSMLETIRHIVAQRGVAGLYQVRQIPLFLAATMNYTLLCILGHRFPIPLYPHHQSSSLSAQS